MRHVGHGVLGTASAPSLEQTMGGGLHKTRKREPRTITGGGMSPHTSGLALGQDLNLPQRFPRNSRLTLPTPLQVLVQACMSW